MINEKMREEFEEFVRMNVYSGSLTKNADGDYFDHVVGPMWIGWKASREALVIELPEERVARGYGEQVADALGFNDGVEYCREAIETAGLKCK